MTRNDFKRIPELRRDIARALNLWENAIESATRTTTLITGMPKGNGVSSQVETAVVKAETYKAKYDELCEELKEIYRQIKVVSKRMSEQEAKVLDLFYPKCMKVADIAKDMQITERHVYRLKKDAISKACRY